MRYLMVCTVVALLLGFSGGITVHAQDGGGFNPQDQQPPPEGGVSPFVINMDGLVDTASDFFNSMWPVFAIIAGVGLGLLILKFVLASIKGATGSG